MDWNTPSTNWTLATVAFCCSVCSQNIWNKIYAIYAHVRLQRYNLCEGHNLNVKLIHIVKSVYTEYLGSRTAPPLKFVVVVGQLPRTCLRLALKLSSDWVLLGNYVCVLCGFLAKNDGGGASPACTKSCEGVPFTLASPPWWLIDSAKIISCI